MTLVDLLGKIGVSGNAAGSGDGLLASGILCDCTGLLGGVTNVGEAGEFGVCSRCGAGVTGELGDGSIKCCNLSCTGLGLSGI